jgi:hypothetical protein
MIERNLHVRAEAGRRRLFALRACQITKHAGSIKGTSESPIHKCGFFSLGMVASCRGRICGEAFFMNAAAGNPLRPAVQRKKDHLGMDTN